MPFLATQGAASARGFGLTTSLADRVFIEDVFSTYLYTGTSQPGDGSQFGYLVNNIDLLTKGGMIWTKDRSTNATGTNDHVIVDTLRGTGTWPVGTSNSPYYLKPNTTAGQSTGSDMIQGVTTTGYFIGGGNTGADAINTLNNNYCSWTFRKQPKFFDVVTWNGTNNNPTEISHNLGSTPGCIIVKRTDSYPDGITSNINWYVYHRDLDAGNTLSLNLTTAQTASPSIIVPPITSTSFTAQGNVNRVNQTYVAYLFAHNAGGFGTAGIDNVISCGSYTGAASDVSVSLGYEPQYLLIKNASSTTNWYMVDIMRGLYGTTTPESYLYPNSSNAEATDSNRVTITSTGFIARAGTTTINDTGNTYIYMAIRRGPMKTPTSGTSVFSPVARTGTSATTAITGVGFTPDVISAINRTKTGADVGSAWIDRLRGPALGVFSSSTGAESSDTTRLISFDMNGVTVGSDGTGQINESPRTYINYLFRRAPGFFDVVCYTGDGTTNRSISHNLQAAPELIIRKSRSNTGSWSTLTKFETSNYIELNLNSASEGSVRSYAANQYLSAKPTSTVFTVNTTYNNNSGVTFVAYLFSTLAGVSKVGTYTGTGTTQTINCGFTAGARFVLIKRYDPDFSGDWFVWDSARGIVSGNDPYLLLNSTAAEVTNTDYIDTASSGFEISSTAPAAINADGGTFIFLAIA